MNTLLCNFLSLIYLLKFSSYNVHIEKLDKQSNFDNLFIKKSKKTLSFLILINALGIPLLIFLSLVPKPPHNIKASILFFLSFIEIISYYIVIK